VTTHADRESPPWCVRLISELDAADQRAKALSKQKARELVLRAGNYNVNRVRFKNPFIPGLRFTVGTGLEILLGHQRRHLLQAERIRERLEFPGQAS
jgi:hypothetical protein